MPAPTPAEYVEMPVRITRDGIFIGEHQIPGCIADGGVRLKPGGAHDVNRLTVEFYVGPVQVDDPLVWSKEVDTPVTETATQYGVKQPTEPNHG